MCNLSVCVPRQNHKCIKIRGLITIGNLAAIWNFCDEDEEKITREPFVENQGRVFVWRSLLARREDRKRKRELDDMKGKIRGEKELKVGPSNQRHA